MAIKWQAALRLYAKQKGMFVVPKKGSAEYEAVKKLQNETADGPEHAVKARASKKAKAVAAAPEVAAAPAKKGRKAAKDALPAASSSTVVDGAIKGRRAPTKKGKAAAEVTNDILLPPAKDTKPLEAAGGAGSRAEAALKKSKVKNAEAAPVKKRRGVKSDGLTAGAATQEFLVNENVMGGGAASAQLPGQKKRLKQTLAKKEDEVKVVTVGEGEERTLEGMKTDDPEAVSGRAPFSFQALRNRLLC